MALAGLSLGMRVPQQAVGAEKKHKALEKQIADAIRRLGDDDFDEREKAQKELVKIGIAGFAPVRAATRSKDLEVAKRARAVLKAITAARHTFRGHTGWVNGVAFSPDGRHVLSASYDGTVRLTDTRTGREVRRVAHPHGRAAAFSPDRNRVFSAAGGVGDALRIWDLKAGRVWKHLRYDEVCAVACSADGRLLAFSWCKEVVLLDLQTGKQRRPFTGHTGYVMGVAITRDGKRVASVSGDHTVRLWDSETGKEVRRFRGNKEEMQVVTFSPDGKRLLCGGPWDKLAWLWEVSSGKAVRFAGHAEGVHAVAFSPDGRRAATGSEDKTIILWDVKTASEIHRYRGHEGPVYDVTFSPDGLLASGGKDATVRVWHLPR
jgi:WD40 repeat protein